MYVFICSSKVSKYLVNYNICVSDLKKNLLSMEAEGSAKCHFEAGTPLGIQKFNLDVDGKTVQDKFSSSSYVAGNQNPKMKTEKQKMLKPTVKNQGKYYANNPYKLDGNNTVIINNSYNVGGNKKVWDANEAAELLLKRDYPGIAEITESYAGQSVQIFVPQSWLSKVPTVVNTEDFATKQEDFKSLPVDVEKKKFIKLEVDRKLRGDQPEKDLYEELKKFFSGKSEDVVVLHGSELLELDLEKRKKKDKAEKDYLIINKTHQYVMNIEVKATISLEKHEKKKNVWKNTLEEAGNQVKECKQIFEDIFGSDITNSWRFIGAVYCCEMKGIVLPFNLSTKTKLGF